MKRIFKRIVGFFSMVILMISTSGCSDLWGQGPVLTYGDFYYCYLGNVDSMNRAIKESAKGIGILGITEVSQKKKTIVIPESIDGLPVIAIGMAGTGGGTSLIVSGAQYNKIYLSKNIQRISHWDIGEDIKVFTLAIPNKEFFFAFGGMLYVAEIDSQLYQPYLYNNERRDEKYPGVRVIIANLTYIVDEEVYWIDDYEEGEKIDFPIEPTKEGYIFDGWYKDSECLVEWNEEKDAYSKAQEGQTVNLYAKWIKDKDD